MMKKLLTMLAVLAMASAANATWDFAIPTAVPGDLANGETAAVTLSATGEEATIPGMVVVTVDGAVVVDTAGLGIVDVTGADFAADITGDPDATAYLAAFGLTDPVSIVYFEIIDVAVPPAAIPDGAVVTGINLTGASDTGTATVSLFHSGIEQVVASANLNLVPEPITIALLGLGGLFLRRRK
jgi:hypothetical protein